MSNPTTTLDSLLTEVQAVIEKIKADATLSTRERVELMNACVDRQITILFNLKNGH